LFYCAVSNIYDDDDDDDDNDDAIWCAPVVTEKAHLWWSYDSVAGVRTKPLI
jgi:hypothetical protein